MHYHRQQIWRKPLMFLNIIKAHNFQTGIKITNKQTNKQCPQEYRYVTYMYVLLNALSFLLPNADTYPEFCFCLKEGGGLLVGMFVQWRGSKTYCWLYYSVYFLKGVGGLDPLISGVIVDGRSRRRWVCGPDSAHAHDHTCCRILHYPLDFLEASCPYCFHVPSPPHTMAEYLPLPFPHRSSYCGTIPCSIVLLLIYFSLNI